MAEEKYQDEEKYQTLNMKKKEDCNLYHYQQNIIQWMSGIRDNPIHGSKGGVLFVEMGLGKTFTTLEYIRQTNAKNTLIICSKTLIQEWLKQIEKFYDVQPKVFVLHSDFNNLKNVTVKDLKEADIVLTTYNIVSRANKINSDFKISDRLIWKEEITRKKSKWCIDNHCNGNNGILTGIHSLYSMNWSNLICDECQTITNWKTSCFQAIYALNSTYVFGLSGTPIKNNKNELMTTLKFLRVTGYNYPSDWKKDRLYDDLFTLFYDVNYEKARIELPDINEIILELDANDLQKNLIEKYICLWEKYISSARDTYGDLITKLMGLFTRFRQINIDPFLLVQTESGVKQFIEATIMDEEQLASVNQNNYKSFNHGIEFGTAKFEEIKRIITEVKARQEKVIIFTSFSSYLKMIEQRLPNEPMTFIQSEDSITSRMSKINKWKKDPHNHILMMNYRIGAEGLNLTEANNVILLDTWWNFTFEKQAIARCNRIGQEKNVNVYRLIYKNSIETLMFNKSVFKSDIFNKIKNNENLNDSESCLSLENMNKIIKYMKTGVGKLELRTGNKDECPICLGDLEGDTHTTECGHDFHTACISQWRQVNNTCPCCRGNL